MAVDAPPDTLAWSYDTTANRYRHGPSGRFVGSETIRNLRNDFLDARAANARSLAADLASDTLSLPEWETKMQDEIKLTHGAEYAFGRGGLNQMKPADWETLGTLVAEQHDYLNQFADDISQGDLTEAEIGARAEMYTSSAVGAYERGAASAESIDLPVYPGDDCLGLSNCRCSWQLDAQDDGSTDCYWLAETDACEICAEHANDYNPLTVE